MVWELVIYQMWRLTPMPCISIDEKNYYKNDKKKSVNKNIV